MNDPSWSASGGITDNGNWSDDKVLWGAIHSPVVGTPHDTFTLNGNNGSIKEPVYENYETYKLLCNRTLCNVFFFMYKGQ